MVFPEDPRDDAPIVEQLGALLLEIYRLVATTTPDDFQRRVLAAIETVIPFDSSMWGVGASSPQGVHVYAMHLDRQPSEMVESYERIKLHDAPGASAQSRPGHTFNVWADEPGRRFHPEAVAHAHRFGMVHTLTTVLNDPALGLFAAVSLYRAEASRSFSERERLLKQALMPHLVETWGANRLAFVSSPPAAASQGRRALCNRRGLLYAAAPGFTDLLQLEWPSWRGPELPQPLQGSWLAQRRAGHPGRSVVVMSQSLGDFRLLTARPRGAIDTLTRRELEVARHFGGGAGHQAVARRLGVAPATVRNHLQAVYRKLGIDNKAALVHALRDAGDD